MMRDLLNRGLYVIASDMLCNVQKPVFIMSTYIPKKADERAAPIRMRRIVCLGVKKSDRVRKKRVGTKYNVKYTGITNLHAS